MFKMPISHTVQDRQAVIHHLVVCLTTNCTVWEINGSNLADFLLEMLDVVIFRIPYIICIDRSFKLYIQYY